MPAMRPILAEDDDDLAPRRRKRREDVKVTASADELTEALGVLAEVRMPTEADEPILGASVRMAVAEWMAEIRSSAELKKVSLEPRRTTLLYGPPGCGKTTLAHHFAARLGYPLVILNATAANSMFLGATGQNLVKFFSVLAEHPEPVVTLLDELDALGATRATVHGGAGEKDANAVVTGLLTYIEAFKGILFAATNRQDALDPALWRRFGMQIDVKLPELDERFAIIKRYGLPFDLADDFIDTLALLTAGAAPSLLRQVMEGMKRALVLGPRLKRDTSKAVDVFRAIVAQVAPHPDYKPPELWRNPDKALDHLAGLAWPPAIIPAEKR